MTTTFAELGLSPALVKALTREGITEPFPIQTLTIPDALAGRDLCGKAETGSGKTLAFGLPLLERLPRAEKPARPTGLVLVPTRELARQVVGNLTPLAVAAQRRVIPLYGGTKIDRDVSRLHKGADIAVATPGRLIDLLRRGDISLDGVEALVIDEADRMADMGFLPQVDWVLRHLGPAHRQTLLFSATLDREVDVLVKRNLHDPAFHEVAQERPTVEAMIHRFLGVHQMDRVKVTAAIATGAERTLVFCRTKRGADRLALQLEKERIKVRAIHGGLAQGARERALRQFGDGSINVLVATDVAARGIHVDDVDVVVHFDPPEDHKAYLHRSGRTARAGRAGVVATYVLWNQSVEMERMMRQLAIKEPIVEVFSNDPRLLDLVAFSTAEGDRPLAASSGRR